MNYFKILQCCKIFHDNLEGLAFFLTQIAPLDEHLHNYKCIHLLAIIDLDETHKKSMCTTLMVSIN